MNRYCLTLPVSVAYGFFVHDNWLLLLFIPNIIRKVCKDCDHTIEIYGRKQNTGYQLENIVLLSERNMLDPN